MLRYRKIERRGQIGETFTWVFATVIILVIMLVALWISFLISKTKLIAVANVNSDLEKESTVLTVKTSLAEQLNSQNKQMIEDILKKQNGG